MLREFIYFESFDKKWTDLGLTEDNLIKLENIIMYSSDKSNLIQGTGGLRKLRFALPNKVKSGGVRVLYVDFISFEIVVVINVYAKNRQDNITDKEKTMYKKMINEMLNDIKGGQL